MIIVPSVAGGAGVAAFLPDVLEVDASSDDKGEGGGRLAACTLVGLKGGVNTT